MLNLLCQSFHNHTEVPNNCCYIIILTILTNEAFITYLSNRSFVYKIQFSFEIDIKQSEVTYKNISVFKIYKVNKHYIVVFIYHSHNRLSFLFCMILNKA